MVLFNNFEDARKGQSSENAGLRHMLRMSNDRVNELKEFLAVKDRELMGDRPSQRVA